MIATFVLMLRRTNRHRMTPILLRFYFRADLEAVRGIGLKGNNNY